MNHGMPSTWTRRDFLHTGLVLASASVTLPSFLQRSALAMQNTDPLMGSIPGVPEDRVLVVVQLSGGNDGLNTVVPFADPAYHNARRGIAIGEQQVHRLNSKIDIGLHPSMDGLKSLYDDGLLTVVQGVGYPNPNRSHFTSMDIWHSAQTNGIGDGWLGRFYDNQCSGSPAADAAARGEAPGDADGTSGAGIAIGRSAPLAMQGRKSTPISFESPDLFRWTGLDLHEALADPYHELAGRDAGGAPAGAGAGETNAEFLTRTTLDAQVASDRIRRAVEARPLVPYPRSGLSQQLAMVASMIRAGLRTRVFYVSMGGFDTHAGQGGVNGSHSNLLRQYADAMRAFHADLKAQGNDGRVLTMTFSEFGRRVAQNGTNGTDHGTAAPVFLSGPMVRAGVHGGHPSLTDLDDGDLKFHTDFRSVYATILEKWLVADSTAVLGKKFSTLPVFTV
ncbi:MAG: DUF1501 domain-containing protein [Phycisphaerales bacterium]